MRKKVFKGEILKGRGTMGEEIRNGNDVLRGEPV